MARPHSGAHRAWAAGRSALVCAALLAICALCAPAALAGPPAKVKNDVRMHLPAADRVVVLAMDQVTWDDIQAAYTPNLDRLAKLGAVGVMNTATLTPRDAAEAHLALGAGSRGLAPPGAGAVPANNSRGRLRALFVPSIATIREHNKTYRYSVTPGLLGKALKDNGTCPALITYDDAGSIQGKPVIHRSLSLALMDPDGLIPFASLNNVLPAVIPEDKPTLVFLAPVREALAKCRVVGIYFGGTSRAESQYTPTDIPSEDELEPGVLMAVDQADALAGALIRELKLETRDPAHRITLIVLVPYNDAPVRGPITPQQTIEDLPQNSPIIFYGPAVPAGVLTSDTTRHRGLVANIDVAPTILTMLGLPVPQEMTGKLMAVLPHEKDPARFVADINRRTRSVDRFRTPGQTVYAALHLAAAALAGLLLMWPAARRVSALRVALRLLALTLILFPAACLLLPAVTQPRVSVPVSFAVTFGTSLIAAIVLMAWFRSRPWALFAALCAPPLLVALDLAFGWGLNTANIFSFSLISGKRFYGLGNEGMGVVVGAATMAAAVLISTRNLTGRKAAATAAAVLFITAVVIGFPRLGVNSGGALTAATAMVVLAVIAGGRRFGLKHVALTVLVLGAFVALLVIVSKIPGASRPTHVTSTMEHARDQGIGYLWEIIERKVAIHRSVMRATVYPVVLAAILGLLAWVWRRPGSRLRALLTQRPAVAAGASACLAAAMAGYFLNDSGLPVMAVIIGYASASVCWFAPDYSFQD